MKRRIKVTREDISEGIPRDPRRCPIANVLQRKFNDQYHSEGAVRVSSGLFYIALYFRGGTCWRSKHPRGVTAWIEKFDARRPVAPIIFTAEFERMADGWVA